MFLSRTLLCAALVLPLSSAAMAKRMKEADMLRAQAEHVCYDDAQRLCGAFVPDEAKIATCMRAKRVQLSPACGKVFDKGMKMR